MGRCNAQRWVKRFHKTIAVSAHSHSFLMTKILETGFLKAQAAIFIDKPVSVNGLIAQTDLRVS